MDGDGVPTKRRKIDGLSDISEGINVKFGTTAASDASLLSVKPDKILKLRKIAASCEKIQSQNADAVLSSVGSSPSSTPCPDSLASLSTPVDPVELKTKLAALVRDENSVNQAELQAKLAAFVRDEKSVDHGELQAKLAALVRSGGDSASSHGSSADMSGQEKGEVTPKRRASEVSDGEVLSPSLKDVDETASVLRDGGESIKMPVHSEEFKALVKRLINEKMKKLEESYTTNIIPSLDKKISCLENANKFLEDRARLLQRNLQTLLVEYRKHLQKSTQRSIGIQTCVEPQPFTTSGGKIVPLPNQALTRSESIPGLHKPTSSTSQMTSSMTSSGPFPHQSAVSGMRYPLNSHGGGGSMYTTASVGQPRLYSGGNHRPGQHPNAVVSSRPYQTFARPNAPITAAVYPQPQNVSPSNHNMPRNSPPSPRNQSPPGGYNIYTQQTPNGIVIRTSAPKSNPATQSLPYPGNADRRAHPMPVHVTLGPRHQMVPTGTARPPPDYQSTVIRQQNQTSYQPGPRQMTSIRHYGVPTGPPSARNAIQSGPRQMAQITETNQMTVRPQTTYVRPGGPPPLVHARPPLEQHHHATQATSPRFQGPGHAMPARPNGSTTGRMNQGLPQVNPAQGRTMAPGSGAPQVRLALPAGAVQTLAQSSPGVPRDLPPPAPDVSISSVSTGIVLSWNMTIPGGCAQIDSYQLFAYQNNGNLPHSPSLWKKLGIVKALPLPMACTLTQFVSGSVYHFAVRAIDVHGRAGNYSAPCAITLPSENGKTAPH